ncbi:MAG TPA: carboxypeptidase-like regulatory domain-containing protein, partial [Pyrinomonadaceae bacterium]|nr:carboxypeptidase-like regulatory domain-containing protein [Pyrinomonadaceae bacterium]
MKIVGSTLDVLIGGLVPEDRNLIASMEVVGGNGLKIRGNYFGLDANGNDLIGGSPWGIKLNSFSGFEIGSSLPGGGNAISGFNIAGILIPVDYAINPPLMHIRGNKIGTDASGTVPVPNSVGIQSGRQNTVIGGIAPGEGNLIAFNGSGVRVSATGNPVRGNSIHSNTGLGVDLTPAGVNSNDFCDLDSGANLGQNFPVIENAVLSGSTTEISGYLATGSPMTQNYTIDFYSSPSPGSTGYGEGMTYLGSTTLSIPSTCAANAFNVVLSVQIPAGSAISATATDAAGNTSEFSQFFGSNAIIGGQVLDGLTGQPVIGVAVDLRDPTNAGFKPRFTSTDISGKFLFSNVPQGGDYVVTPAKQGYTMVPASRNYPNLSANQNDSYNATYRPSIRGIVTMLTPPIYSPALPGSDSDQGDKSRLQPPPRPVPMPVKNVTVTLTDETGATV